MVQKYTIEEIREAVNIVIGDDGSRSKRIIEILRMIKQSDFMMEEI
jgi:hypothetical protein